MSSALPIHFFTIVLNGEPFIRYHIEVFKNLPFPWHWHIVEGLAALRNDTAWSVQLGGRITDDLHRNARSKDGTSEYLDQLAQEFPDNVTIYRKPEGVMWDGKLEMVNAPLAHIQTESLLWQVDVDELWTQTQIEQARSLFVQHPNKTAAFFRCWYFVGPDLVISNRYCFTQHPNEWLRAWRFLPGARWSAHEPPTLVQPVNQGAGLEWQEVMRLNPFLEEETEAHGLVFQHFSYVTPEQLEFKERYYGYANIVSEWRELLAQPRFPVLLRQFFSWISDGSMVDKAATCGITPIAQLSPSGEWQFFLDAPVEPKDAMRPQAPTIVLDGVAFQSPRSGISKLWRSLLETWATQKFGQHLIVLDRGFTAAPVAGIRYRSFPAYSVSNWADDQALLQQVCDEENAAVFISTHYTAPLSTPSVFLAYDLQLDAAGAVQSLPEWRDKQRCIESAIAFLTVSQSNARELVQFFPSTAEKSIVVAPAGTSALFASVTAETLQAFCHNYGIAKPYFLLTAVNGSLKGDRAFFAAFAQLSSRSGFEIVCTGDLSQFPAEFRTQTAGSTVHTLNLEDEELAVAYSGAIALVYSSQFDSLGLPVLEAIACGCPVITRPTNAMQELVGDGVLWVDGEDGDGLAEALCEVQKPSVRRSLAQSKSRRSWSAMAAMVQATLIATTLRCLNLRSTNLIAFPNWQQPEEALLEDLRTALRVALTHPDPDNLTLLLTVGEVDPDVANLALSDVTMQLLLAEGLEIERSPEISLITDLHPMQWQVLATHLTARIPLRWEDKGALKAAGWEGGAIEQLIPSLAI